MKRFAMLFYSGFGALAGMTSAGSIAPAVAAADRALAAGSVDELSAKIGDAVRDGIRRRFAEVVEAKEHADESVEAGRAFVDAYVEYVHFVEGIHNMVARGGTEEH